MSLYLYLFLLFCLILTPPPLPPPPPPPPLCQRFPMDRFYSLFRLFRFISGCLAPQKEEEEEEEEEEEKEKEEEICLEIKSNE